jgi:hypothetical protein
MARSRTEYHFRLPRRKRISGVLCRIPLGFVGLSFFGASMFLVLTGVWWAFVPGMVALFLARGFLVALTRFISRKQADMCLAVDENGVGYGEQTPDWWIFADGITYLKAGRDGWWVLHHVNGTFLYFPVGVVSDDDIAYLQSKKVQAVTKPSRR